jgi:hypothetical protein
MGIDEEIVWETVAEDPLIGSSVAHVLSCGSSWEMQASCGNAFRARAVLPDCRGPVKETIGNPRAMVSSKPAVVREIIRTSRRVRV